MCTHTHARTHTHSTTLAYIPMIRFRPERSLCRPALLTGILKWSQDTNHAGSFHSRHTQSYLDYLGWNWPWVLAAELLRGTNAPFHKYWYQEWQECQKVKGQCSGPHNTQVINLIKITKLWQYSFAQMNRDLDEKLKHPFFFEQQIAFVLFKESNQDNQKLIVLLRQHIRVNPFHSDNLLQ